MCADVFRLYANFDIKFCFLDVLLGLELDDILWQRPTSGTNTNGTVFFSSVEDSAELIDCLATDLATFCIGGILLLLHFILWESQ